jgi:hypothetical protein
MTDFFDELERELRWAYRRDTGRHARSRLPVGRRLPGLPATGLRTLAALALVVALVAVVLSVARNSDVERHAAPRPATGAKVVTDVEAGIRFSLDGRVLTVQLLPTVRTVSGARISATCGAKVATPTSDPRATILTRLWPTGQTSLSYGFPRDVSGWCRLEDQFGSFVAFAKFPGASPPLPLPGPRVRITETADNWARLLASSAQACNDYAGRTVCEQVNCRRVRGTLSEGCRPVSPRYAAEFRGVTVEEIAISGDRAAATFSNSGIVQLRRTATGEWLIDKLGPFGAVGSSK